MDNILTSQHLSDNNNNKSEEDRRIANEFDIDEFQTSPELRAAMSQETHWRTIGMEMNNNNDEDDEEDEDDDSDDDSVVSAGDVCGQTALNSVDNTKQLNRFNSLFVLTCFLRCSLNLTLEKLSIDVKILKVFNLFGL